MGLIFFKVSKLEAPVSWQHEDLQIHLNGGRSLRVNKLLESTTPQSRTFCGLINSDLDPCGGTNVPSRWGKLPAGGNLASNTRCYSFRSVKSKQKSTEQQKTPLQVFSEKLLPSHAVPRSYSDSWLHLCSQPFSTNSVNSPRRSV